MIGLAKVVVKTRELGVLFQTGEVRGSFLLSYPFTTLSCMYAPHAT